jgi:CheY-like chemotaxis protein
MGEEYLGRVGRLAKMGHALGNPEWSTGPLSPATCKSPPQRELLVLVIEDAPVLSRTIGFLCDYLGITVEAVPANADLAKLLRSKRPMAVMSMIDTRVQDGCHVLETVAEHDRTLPVLLVTGNDPALLGVVEAVQEIWQLGHVLKVTGAPGVGDVIEFLFKAGRRSGSTLMPV